MYDTAKKNRDSFGRAKIKYKIRHLSYSLLS